MKYLSLINRVVFVVKRRFLQPSKPFVYVAMGDSTVEGWGASSPDKCFASLVYLALKQEIKDAQFTNLGEGGAKIKDVIEKQLPKALELKPDLIILSIGANDALQKTWATKFEKDYHYLLKALSGTHAILVVNNIPDVSVAPKIPRIALRYFLLRIKNFNKKIKNSAKRAGAIFIDLYEPSRLLKEYRALVSNDGFHPSDMGYAVWANAIISRIYPLIKF